MDVAKAVAMVAAGLALECLGQPIRSYVGIGAAFPDMHARIRADAGGRPAARPRGTAVRPRLHALRNVTWGEDTLHRPWAGSVSYERKREEAETRSAALQLKQETQSMLRLMDAEADLERRRQASEQRQAEQKQALAAAKDEVRAQRRQKAEAHQAFLQEQTDEIRRRAAEQEALRARRLAEQEAAYDRIMANLQPCRAFRDDGSPCTRKANPGLSFCHLHTGYAGPLQPVSAPPPQETAASAAEEGAVERPAAPPAVAREVRSPALPPIVVQTTAASSSLERLLVILAVFLAVLACLTALGGLTVAGARLLPRR